DPRFQRHHLLLRADPVPVRHRPGTGIRGHAVCRYHHEPPHGGVRNAGRVRPADDGSSRRNGERMSKGPSTAAARPTAGTKAPPVEHRFTEIIPPNLGIDFVGLRFKMLLFSWGLIMIGLISMYLRGGLNYGIDFAGGTMVHVRFSQPTTAADIRSALALPELHEVVVQNVGKSGQEFQVRVLG